MVFGTVIITVLLAGLVDTVVALLLKSVGVDTSLATRTVLLEILTGMKVLDGKVIVIVPLPALSPF